MELIPVLDLSQGMAVHARGGDRAEYRPVHSILAPERDGDPLLLARRFRARVNGLHCYVADLDGLTGGARQLDLIRRLANPDSGFGAGLLVDSGVSDPVVARQLLEAGASTIIVALESLPGRAALDRLLTEIGPGRLLLSLDLRAGVPIVVPDGEWLTEPDPVALAGSLIHCGVDRLLLLDLALVGKNEGPPVAIIEAIRSAHPAIPLLAGGGVRDAADLVRLERLGVEAALVATALHDGRLAGYIASR